MNLIKQLNDLFNDKEISHIALTIEFDDKELLNRLSGNQISTDNETDDLPYFIESMNLSSNGENYTGILLDIRRKQA